MPVQTALMVINEEIDEVLSGEEADLDPDSRFALTWFQQFGYSLESSDEADKLARAKNTAVSSIIRADIICSQGDKVRILTRDELKSPFENDNDWSLTETKRLTDWEATQHLIRCLQRSEMKAAVLLRQLGGIADRARQLAYLLYAVCDQKKWSEEAVAYNNLITAWPELSRLASTTAAGQQKIL